MHYSYFFFFLFLGYEKSYEGVYISKIKPYEGADNDLVKPLQVGQQIKAINGKPLAGKSYLEIVEVIRDTRDSYTLNLLVADVWEESKKKGFTKKSNCALL